MHLLALSIIGQQSSRSSLQLSSIVLYACVMKIIDLLPMGVYAVARVWLL